MKKVNYIRSGMTVISIVGVILLIRIIFQVINGEILNELPPDLRKQDNNILFALAISLPVPFHVISIGMILQKKWLSYTWKKIAWISIVISGIWLGIALLVKTIIK